MIVACPRCGRRYRIDPGRLAGGERRRLRCNGCGEVFAATPEGVEPRAAQAPAPAGGGGAPLVLVGDEDREFRDLVARTLTELGCRVEATDDGEAAFRFAVARHPDLMILNVYLRKLLGVAVCEGVKGSPDLKSIKVALVGSVFKSDRFVRGPGHLYGADDYFENVIPVDELRQRLRRLLEAAPGPDSASDRPRPAQAADSAAPGWRGGTLDGAGPSHGRAADSVLAPLDPPAEIRRLARIMLSDLKIYRPEDFREALLTRRFFETFKEELTKGKELIDHRFPGRPDRLQVLAAALKEGISRERAAAGGAGAGAP
jgi:predicted Zn finger-like uncharacterized protein